MKNAFKSLLFKTYNINITSQELYSAGKVQQKLNVFESVTKVLHNQKFTVV